jgi:hypothetical protein
MSKNDKYYSPERFMEFIIPERQDDFAEEFNKMFNGKLYATPVRVRRLLDYLFEWSINEYSIKPEEILNQTRQQHITIIRHIMMFVVYENFKGVISLTDVGKMFNRRDHCSVLHARTKCIQNYQFDVVLRERMDSLNQYLSDKGIYVLQKYVNQ